MRKSFQSAAVLLSLSVILGGCGSTVSTETAAAETSVENKQSTDGSIQNVSVSSLEDKYVSPEQGTVLSNDTTKIKESGCYVLSGDYSALTINTDDAVTLILNGCTITGENSPAIEVKKAESVTVCLVPNTTNTLTDTTEGEEDASACFYCDAPLWICGSGSLTVNGKYNDGIQSTDVLTIADGNITVDAADDCIIGRDSVVIGGGSLTLNGSGHGIKTTNEELGEIALLGGSFDINVAGDALHSVQNLSISGGSYQITAEDDALRAENTLTLSGGDIVVESCYEGLEGKYIELNGGNVELTASDDGINAADSTEGNSFGGFGAAETLTAEEILAGNSYIHITDGIYIVHADGDGIDSNDSVLMEGGSLTVYGPTNDGNGALDYDKAFLMNGGTLIAIGSSGMAQSPSSNSTQNVVVAGGNFAAGDEIILADESGNEFVCFTNEKTAQNLVVSTPDLTDGTTVTLTVNGTELGSAELTEGTTTIGEVNSFGGFGGGFGGGNRPDQSDKGQHPENFDPSQVPDNFDPSQIPNAPDSAPNQNGNPPDAVPNPTEKNGTGEDKTADSDISGNKTV